MKLKKEKPKTKLENPISEKLNLTQSLCNNTVSFAWFRRY